MCQWELLEEIKKHDWIDSKTLNKIHGCNLQSTQAILRRLLKAGLVIRKVADLPHKSGITYIYRCA